jgi:hypothetical protein
MNVKRVPMQIGPEGVQANRTAALVYFGPGVTPETAIEILRQAGVARQVREVTVGEYDPTWGSPVWYIP